MRFVAAFACALILTCLGALPGHAGRRVALIIGNGAYRDAPVLANPRNDAVDVGRSLELLGFRTIVAIDLDRNGMNDALDRFSRMIADTEIALVYYSGHAMQYEGRNYLLPIDAQLSSAADVSRLRLTLLNDIVDVLQAAPGARVIVLDSCRNNPLENELKRRVVAIPGRSRDALPNRGLVRVSAATGMIIVYATQSGEVADDGTGRNSQFTAAFLNNVGTPEIDLRLMFFHVQDEVARTTNGRQRPEISTSLTGEIKLTSVAPPPPPPPLAIAKPSAAMSPPSADPSALAWAAVQNTTSIAVLEEFLRRYGNSFYAPFADARISELRNSRTAAAAFPAPPQNAGPCNHASIMVSLSSRPAMPLSGAETCALKPKDVFKECEKCPEMVVVPAGGFMMGSSESEKGRELDEGPRHPVTFARPFAAGRFAVTFDEWDACTAAGACNRYRPADQGWGRGRRPAINVSWDDAQAYVAWLSASTGKAYRMLSEAEHEYVTRAGTATPFWWGDFISPRQANYDGSYTYGGGPTGEYRQRTLTVDSFQPNPWGFYQVHGNVKEWTQDCYHSSYAGAPADGTPWLSGDCRSHVLRGGSWNNDPWFLRATVRNSLSAGYRSNGLGFRVGRTLAP